MPLNSNQTGSSKKSFLGRLAASPLYVKILLAVLLLVLIAAGVDSIRHVIETPYVQGAFIGVIACIVGMGVVTALKMRKKAVRNVFGWCVAIGCFVGLSVFRISPAWLIVAAIAAGLIKVGVGSALKKIHPEKGEAAQ